MIRAAITAGAVATLTLAIAACNGASATTSTESTKAPTTSSATADDPDRCPTPAPATTPPVDFPHPDVVRQPASGPTSAADMALARQGLGATTLAGPISRRAFAHYLDRSGAYLTLPVDELLSARPALVAALNQRLTAAVTEAVHSLQQATITTCQAQTFTSGWTTFDDPARDDWYYTLGTFAYQVVGSVVPAATSCIAAGCIPPVVVTYQAAIGDTYNFDPGTTFAQFGQLALDGTAADFLDGGLTTGRSVTISTSDDSAGLGFGN